MIKVLIPAVGGQGGGILMDWLIRAGRYAGVIARGVALPGLSQRAGGTAYYVELAAAGAADAAPAAGPGLFPVPGDIDLIVAQEFLELGRALQAGFATPDRTLVIANTHRFLSTLEKLPGGPGIYPSAVIERAAFTLARRAVLLDIPALLRTHDLSDRAANAVLAGVLAASGALPIPAGAWQEAIRETGVAVEANLAAFAVGLAQGASDAGDGTAGEGTAVAASPDTGALTGEWAAALGRRGSGYRQLWERMQSAFPPALHRTLAEAAYLLTAYQDLAYAGEYLDRIAPFAAAEPAQRAAADLPPDIFPLTEAMARQVGRWMLYEDAPRVAALKTDPRRFQRLRQEHGARGVQAMRVVEYLAPEPWDLYTLLPHGLVRAITGRPVTADPPPGRHLPLRIATSGLGGYLLLRALTWLRPLRRRSYRMAWERVRLDHYCHRVQAIAATDYELGVLAAGAGDLVRGYGAVRRHGLAALREFLEKVADPPVANVTPEDRQALLRRAREYLQQAAALAPQRGRHPA